MKKYFLCFIGLVMLVGCVPMYPIEKLGVISIVGIDAGDEGELESTFDYFKFDPTGKNQSATISTKSQTFKGTQDSANLESNLKIVQGHLRLILFGKSLAEKGLIRVLDNFSRDAKLSDTMYLAATEGTAKKILTTADTNQKINAEDYLYELIDNNIKREIIMRSTFRDFMHDYNVAGIDPVLPLLTLENQKPIIKDLALFKDDKYVATATQQEGFFIKLLSSKFKAGQLELAIAKEPFKKYINPNVASHEEEDKVTVTLSEIRSKTKSTLTSEKKLTYDVKVEIETRLLEISEKIEIENKEISRELEKEIEKTITDKLNSLMDKLKELSIDPIGFGSVYDSSVRGVDLTDEQWREKIPDINANFDVNVKLLRIGMTE